MWSSLSLFVVPLTVAVHTPAVDSDWERVIHLERGERVEVLTRDGRVARGVLTGVNAEGLALVESRYEESERGDTARRIDKKDVVEVRRKKASGKKKALGIALGATAGFFGGAMIGAFTEVSLFPCDCDDPGLTGLIIGAPVGAAVGSVVGYKLASRGGGSLVYQAGQRRGAVAPGRENIDADDLPLWESNPAEFSRRLRESDAIRTSLDVGRIRARVAGSP